MTARFAAKTPADVIAAVPFMIGFQPEDSLVAVSVAGGPTARVDMPHTGDDLVAVAATIGSAMRQYPGNLVLVAYTDQSEHAIDAFTALTAILDGFCDVIDAIVTHAGEWTRLDGTTGTVDEATRDRVAAELVGRGLPMPAASRAARSFDLRDGDHAAVAAAAARLAEPAVDHEEPWMRQRIAEFTYTHAPLSDEDAARMLRNCTDSALRDVASFSATRETAHAQAAMWRDLTRRAPASMLGAPACLLALNCWLAGDGAAAWDALDVLEDPKSHALATIVELVLTNAIHPSKWEELRGEVAGE